MMILFDGWHELTVMVALDSEEKNEEAEGG